MTPAELAHVRTALLLLYGAFKELVELEEGAANEAVESIPAPPARDPERAAMRDVRKPADRPLP